ncbi:response regulator, partial [Collinsella aerofaciens]|nr:response regulator [Collinsella aerofaciens]
MLHISICDDEQMAAERIQGLIEKELKEQRIAYQMDLFKNGEEFLSQYQIRSEELIFLDIDMPVKSGIEVIEELEEVGKNKDV